MGYFVLIKEYLDYVIPAAVYIGWIWYAIVFLISFCETFIVAGVFVPGMLFFVLIGLLSAQGHLDVVSLLLVAFSGAFCGDLISYIIGRHRSHGFFKEGHFLYKSKHLIHAEEYLRRHGVWGVLYSRFVSALRPFVPYVAGIENIPVFIFIVLDLAGGVMWATAYVGLGFLFGLFYQEAIYWSQKGALTVLMFAGGTWLYFYLFRFLSHRKEAIIGFVGSLWRSVEGGLAENEYIKRFSYNHPRLAAFLRNRFSSRYYFGIYVTLAFVFTCLLLYLFVVVLSKVIFSSSLLDTDLRIIRVVNYFQNDLLSDGMMVMTIMGKWYVVALLALFFCLVMAIRRSWYAVIAVITSIAGGEMLAFVLKEIVQRKRPTLLFPAAIAGGYSFPSAHAVIAVVFYGLVGYFFIKKAVHWRTKVALFLGTGVVVFLIGVSRIYLGVHYPSDVFAGFILGFMWLINIIFGLEIRRKFFPETLARKSGDMPPAGKKTIVVLFFIATISTTLVVGYAFLTTEPVHNIAAPGMDIVRLSENTVAVDALFEGRSRYSEDIYNNKMEPMSFVFVGNRKEIEDAFAKAGWYEAERNMIRNMFKVYYFSFIDKAYNTAPVSPSFLDGVIHTIAFQKPTDQQSARQRHHIRLWSLPFVTNDGKEVYAATASYDSGIKLFAHEIDPAIDEERNFIKNDLMGTGRIDHAEQVAFVRPHIGENFVSDVFFTDGNLYVMYLR